MNTRTELAALLNLAEDTRPESRRALAHALSNLGPERGLRVGITGAPGSGKSSLLSSLDAEIRRLGKTLAVIAVDPTSQVSGGSLLGDRARMYRHGTTNPDEAAAFIRSLATDGRLGGLSRSVFAALRILNAHFDLCFVETTGVGQNETEVSRVVDLTVLVIQPASGDTLQFIKSGIMEVPDVIVVNKADLGSIAQRAMADLTLALEAQGTAADHPTRLMTSTVTSQGIEELAKIIIARTATPPSESQRAAQAIQWVCSEFTAEHGGHGVRIMGGKDALREHIALALERTCPLDVMVELSQIFCKRMAREFTPDP